MARSKVLEIGDIVYYYGAPQHPGKIINLESSQRRQYAYITWVAKSREDSKVDVISLKKLEDLIEDHTKKLKGHKSRLKKAEAL